MCCPKGGKTNVVDDGCKGEFGTLFVAEETNSSTECADLITAYHCNDCECVWYISMGQI